jgi:hypothetical protein
MSYRVQPPKRVDIIQQNFLVPEDDYIKAIETLEAKIAALTADRRQLAEAIYFIDDAWDWECLTVAEYHRYSPNKFKEIAELACKIMAENEPEPNCSSPHLAELINHREPEHYEHNEQLGEKC